MSHVRRSCQITLLLAACLPILATTPTSSAAGSAEPGPTHTFVISNRETPEINASVAANHEDGNFLVVWTDDLEQEVLSRVVSPPARQTTRPHLGQRSTVWAAPEGHSVDVATAAHGPGTGAYLVLWTEGKKWPAGPGALSRPDDFIQLIAVDDDGQPVTQSAEPVRLTEGRCGAASPALAFDPESRHWLVLWQEHDGPDEGPEGQWNCDVDGPWIVFGHFVSWHRGRPRIIDTVEVDIADNERTVLPRIVYSPARDRFDVLYTTFWTDESITFWPPAVRRLGVVSTTGDIAPRSIDVISQTWGVVLPAATALPGTDLTLVVWTREPGDSQPAITEGRLLSGKPSAPRNKISWAGRWFSTRSEIFPIARHRTSANGAVKVAAATYRDQKALVVWEESSREGTRLRGRFMPYGTSRVRKTRPFDVGTGGLHPDGHGVACVPQGWCLIVFEHDGDIYGRLISARPRR